ncbi:hypothetical protein [Sphingomonas sp.]|uniref:hypothetical protein n=1 Tax=Sphingomonas sp. TaxID=28214 RepID=UPI002FC8C2D6
MRFAVHAASFAAIALLSACGSNTSSKLEEAAEQSDPAAANVLLDQANAIEQQGDSGSLSDPNSPAQQALEAAGNAAGQGTPAPSHQPGPATGAKPHTAGEPVPPPQVGSAPPQGAPKN